MTQADLEAAPPGSMIYLREYGGYDRDRRVRIKGMDGLWFNVRPVPGARAPDWPWKIGGKLTSAQVAKYWPRLLRNDE